jgi:hypothetical protein
MCKKGMRPCTGHHPRLAPSGSRTRLRRGAWLISDRRARRRCGCGLAITRGSRHAAHGLACGVVRDCIPIDVHEGDVAVDWPSPAARAQRLTDSPAAWCVAAFRSTGKKGLWPCTSHHPRLAPCGSRIMAKPCLTPNQFAKYLPLVGRTDEAIE